MSLIGLLTLSAWATPEAEVARGWYLWRTGQDDAAAEHAASIVEAHPDHLGAHWLYASTEIWKGQGASVEARYREAWGASPEDPVRRIALAFAIAQRRPDAGGWCDEVSALLAPMLEGELRYWATVAERQKELRCEGTTDHADSELRRIQKEGGVGWEDGLIAKIEAGYIKEDLPAELKRLLEESPHRMDAVGALWADHVAGPARAKARGMSSRALSDAVEGSDPVLVHAALLAYTQMDKASKIEAAAQRLAALDPEAQIDVVRSVDDVRDPEIYAEIDACVDEAGKAARIACLEGIEAPEAGAIAAHLQSQLWQSYRIAERPEDALNAARSAWLADPDIRFYARTFAKATLQLQVEISNEDRSAAVDAVGVLLALGPGGAGLPAAESITDARQARWLARDLDLRSEVLLAADRADEALEGQALALVLEETPRRRLLYGELLHEAGLAGDAVLQLVSGLALEVSDTRRIASARALLAEIDGGWHPEGMPGMLREVTRTPQEPSERRDLVGLALPELEALAPVEPGDDEPGDEAGEGEGEEIVPLQARVLVPWAPFAPVSLDALERLAAIGERYAEQGVEIRAIGVGQQPAELPETLQVPQEHGGAEVMRALRIVAIPSAVVVDAEGRIATVLAPWHHNTLDLENALDALLPEEEE